MKIDIEQAINSNWRIVLKDYPAINSNLMIGEPFKSKSHARRIANYLTQLTLIETTNLANFTANITINKLKDFGNYLQL